MFHSITMPMRVAHDHHSTWSTVFISFRFISIEMWCARKYQSIHSKYPYEHCLFHSIPIQKSTVMKKWQSKRRQSLQIPIHSWKFHFWLNSKQILSFIVSNRHSKFRYIRMLSYPMWPMRVCVYVRYEIKTANDGSTVALTHIHTLHTHNASANAHQSNCQMEFLFSGAQIHRVLVLVS